MSAAYRHCLYPDRCTCSASVALHNDWFYDWLQYVHDLGAPLVMTFHMLIIFGHLFADDLVTSMQQQPAFPRCMFCPGHDEAYYAVNCRINYRWCILVYELCICFGMVTIAQLGGIYPGHCAKARGACDRDSSSGNGNSCTKLYLAPWLAIGRVLRGCSSGR